MWFLKRIDDVLNGITMYRLVVYVLSLLLIIAFIFMLTGVLTYSAVGFAITAGVIALVGPIANFGFAKLFNLVPNQESGLITALILTCILPQTPPSMFLERAPLIALTVVLATAVKYVLVWRGSHFLNPAAAGATAVSLLGLLPVTWWIASPPMFLPTLLLGLLILRKTRHFQMFGWFVLGSAVVMLIVSSLQGIAPDAAIKTLVLSYPLLFLGTIMLTEPTTIPVARLTTALYAVLVGVLFSSQLKIGSVDMSPHLALIIGNVFSFAVSPKRGARLRLASRSRLAPNMYELAFEAPSGTKLPYAPGQYMEWTMPGVGYNSRGNRRTFSLSSSPTERLLRIGIKTYDRPSVFKRRILELKAGNGMLAGHVNGDFTLPDNSDQKLLWIAGGIGITPFRSMAKYLIDTHQKRDVVLLYAARADQFVYKDIFAVATVAGIKTIYVSDKLDTAKLTELVPDLTVRTAYISGPPAMVGELKSTLVQAGITRQSIRTDLFTGY